MGFETSKFGKADGSNVTSTVSNHYGARLTGGGAGNLPSAGTTVEYVINYDGDQLAQLFPILDGVEIVDIDETYSTGAVTAITIGGVNVALASEASPVALAANNTGVVAVTGPTAGDLIIKYKRLA